MVVGHLLHIETALTTIGTALSMGALGSRVVVDLEGVGGRCLMLDDLVLGRGKDLDGLHLRLP